MALIQATTPTSRVTLNDVYNTEFISRQWRLTARDPIFGLNLAKEVNLTLEDANSLLYQVPIVDEMTGVAAVADNDAAPEAAQTTGQAQISGQRYALRSFVLDNTKSKVMRTAQTAMTELQKAIRNYVHQQILALFTSITATAGDNTTDNTLSNWDSQTMAFRGGLPTEGMPWATMNPDAIRDLRANLITTSAALFGAAWGDRAHSALAEETRAGLFTTFDGYAIHESHDTPVGDTTGWTNALGVAGEDAGIEAPFWQPLLPALQRDEGRFGTWIVASIIAGWGIIKQTQLRKFITRT